MSESNATLQQMDYNLRNRWVELDTTLSVREQARNTVCKNNLRQRSLAVASYIGIHKRLPKPSAPNIFGGWTVAILPFIEQKTLGDTIVPGSRIDTASWWLLL